MMQHPETVYRLAEHRLAEYREVGAAERLAGTVKSRPYNVVDYLTAWRNRRTAQPAPLAPEREPAEAA